MTNSSGPILTQYSFSTMATYYGEMVDIQYDNLSEGEYTVDVVDADGEIIDAYSVGDYDSLEDFLDHILDVFGQEIYDAIVIDRGTTPA